MSQHHWRLITLGISVVVTIGLSPGSLAGEKVDPVIEKLLVAHNRERKELERKPLKLSLKLCEAARVQAADMAKHKKLSHTGTDGSSVADRVKRAGYLYVRVGENVARGQNSVDEVMETWMKSTGHRANILAEYTEMGAARIEDDEGAYYWCVDFGIPMPNLKPEEAAANVVDAINRERKAAGKIPLKAPAKLGSAAMAISEAMAAKDNLEIGRDPFKLVDDDALEGREIRLQLSANVPTPEEAAKELLGEQPKALDSFGEIGVGYARAKSGTPYWCAIFAKPVGLKVQRKRK